jgi:hypothetical protein
MEAGAKPAGPFIVREDWAEIARLKKLKGGTSFLKS